MSVLQIIFLVAGAVTLLAGVMVVASPKLVHAGLWLIVSLAGVAVLFVLLNANFLAVVQVVVYIGAIAILVIFAVMLTRKVMDDSGAQTTRYWWVALIAVLGIFGGLTAVMLGWKTLQVGPGIAPSDSLITDFGQALVSPQGYSIPFEVASVLLVAALIGAIYVAVERKGGRA